MSKPIIDATLRGEADRRRAALLAAGCSTYMLSRRNGEPVILCLCCGLASHNRNDIALRYCGACHAYHNEEIAIL